MKNIFKTLSTYIVLVYLCCACEGNEKPADGLRKDLKTEERKSEASPQAEKNLSNDLKFDKKEEKEAPIVKDIDVPAIKANENPFVNVTQMPTSTFSIDVDNASYTYTRNFIQNGSLPPVESVRLEEFINYFDYNYTPPTGNQPFSVYSEVGNCPWNDKNKLVHIGLKGKEISQKGRKPANLVFLIDVSGSMSDENKLPLLKRAFTELVGNLGEEDKVSMVVYAGAAGLVLPPTSGGDKSKILNALNNLNAGGSTAGGEGLRLAYQVAEKNKLTNGNNRVIIASDGDFNVGESSDEAMQNLIEEKRKSGVFITVLGFGQGNYQDNKMEIIANKGNGNYYYIDNLNEAKRVLGTGLTSTLVTIAKDVKIQVEFNKQYVKTYRLLGYENRILENKDFADDKKDAGEIGAGHTVTAIYEVELNQDVANVALAELRMRYKEPQSETSQLLKENIKNDKKVFEQCSNEFRFSASVAGFALCLKNSAYKGNLDYTKVLEMAKNSKDSPKQNQEKIEIRNEFLDLVKKAGTLVR